ncbi:hypothetical protein ACFVSU_14340 [Microbacterium sp. NPDC058062]|uniref:hypothetical protein n=1 Tax=Microbacterium sp. NPDC058062 TaxID=3346320 RepID=UPI0036D83682
MARTVDEWWMLRLDTQRERHRIDGRDADAAALARSLLRLGPGEPAEEAHQVLVEAWDRFPDSVAIAELMLFAAGREGDSAQLEAATRRLGRLDPHSAVLAAARTAGEEAAEGAEQWSWRRVEEASSGDPQRVREALEDLRGIAAMYPQRSTYPICLAFALLASGERDDVLETARAAAAIEDGGFEDAYNLGTIFHSCGEDAEAEAYLQLAVRRAPTAEHEELALDALAKMRGAADAQ